MYYYYNDGQYMFDRSRGGFTIVLIGLWKAIIYSPLWFTGYIIATLFLDKEATAFEWLGLITLFSVVVNFILFFLKAQIASLKENNNPLWMLLFTLCVGFTSVFPVWMMFDAILELMIIVNPAHSSALTWCGAVLLGIIMYLRYRF